MTQEKENLEKQLSETEKAKKGIETEFQDLQGQLETSNKEKDNILSESAKLKSELESMTQAKDELEKQLSESTNLKSELESMTQAKDELEKQLSESTNLKSELESMTQEKYNLEKQLSDNISDFKEKLATACSEKKKIESEMEATLLRLREAKDQEISEKEIRIKDLQLALESKRSEEENLDEKTREKEAEFDRLKEELADLKGDITRFKSTIDENEEEIRKHKAIIEDKEKEIVDLGCLKDELERLQTELVQAREIEGRTKEELHKTKQELEERTAKDNEAQKHHTELGQQVAELVSALRDAKLQKEESDKIREERQREDEEVKLTLQQKIIQLEEKLKENTTNSAQETSLEELRLQGIEKEKEIRDMMNEREKELLAQIEKEREERNKEVELWKEREASLQQELKNEKAKTTLLDSEKKSLTQQYIELENEKQALQGIENITRDPATQTLTQEMEKQYRDLKDNLLYLEKWRSAKERIEEGRKSAEQKCLDALQSQNPKSGTCVEYCDVADPEIQVEDKENISHCYLIDSKDKLRILSKAACKDVCSTTSHTPAFYETTDLFGNRVQLPKALTDSTLPSLQFHDIHNDTFSIPEMFFVKDDEASTTSFLSILHAEAEKNREDVTRKSFLLLLKETQVEYLKSNKWKLRYRALLSEFNTAVEQGEKLGSDAKEWKSRTTAVGKDILDILQQLLDTQDKQFSQVGVETL
eukprot:TRINITY_DN4715_c0_g1_i5.p1 TRINITY_DN4715_c0_g1~~TRINITY_DN4715_c0_g1_i5.p1  ORF type:complete len:822 (+),score=262.20 TRINITY_DN4715_c0_g1_i5:341-2467(+)